MTRNRNHLGKLALAAALSGAVGLLACGDDKEDLMAQPGTGDGDQGDGDVGDGDQGDGDGGDGDAGDGDQGDGDGPADPACPALAERPEVVVGGDWARPKTVKTAAEEAAPEYETRTATQNLCG